MTVTTEDGVAYDLDFGELFTGTTYDFAVGDAGEGYKTLSAADKRDDGEEDGEPAEDRRGRYLFVTARPDAAALGEPPTAPDLSAAGDEAAGDGAGGENAEAASAAYVAAKAAYDDRRDAAERRVEELNRRFGDWYYVVDAADVAELSLTPAALLTDAPPALPAATGDAAANAGPGEGGPGTPSGLEDLLRGAAPPMTGEPAPGEPATEEPAPVESTAPPADPRSPLAAPRPAVRPAAEAPPEPTADPRAPLSAPRPAARASSEPPAAPLEPAGSADPGEAGDPGAAPDPGDAADPGDGADDAGDGGAG